RQRIERQADRDDQHDAGEADEEKTALFSVHGTNPTLRAASLTMAALAWSAPTAALALTRAARASSGRPSTMFVRTSCALPSASPEFVYCHCASDYTLTSIILYLYAGGLI